MSERVYGTWQDENGVRHHASGVLKVKRVAGFHEGQWDTNSLCGRWTLHKPETDAACVVTCVRCVWKTSRRRHDYDYLRGMQADTVVIDEVSNVVAKNLADEIDDGFLKDLMTSLGA